MNRTGISCGVYQQAIVVHRVSKGIPIMNSKLGTKNEPVPGRIQN
jgi:hypothetical protein